MGPGVTGLVKERIGKPRTLGRWPPGRVLRAAIQEHLGEASGLPPCIRLRRAAPALRCSRATPTRARDSARATRRPCGTTPARSSAWAASARSWPGTRIRSISIRCGRTSGGSPSSGSTTSSATTSGRCARTWPPRAQEMFEEAGFEIVNVDRQVLTRGLVDPRARHGPHGHGPEDVRVESVPAVARREESLRRGWQQPRQRVVPEPDVDDHGAGLALVRLPGLGIQEGESVMSPPVTLTIANASPVDLRT